MGDAELDKAVTLAVEAGLMQISPDDSKAYTITQAGIDYVIEQTQKSQRINVVYQRGLKASNGNHYLTAMAVLTAIISAHGQKA